MAEAAAQNPQLAAAAHQAPTGACKSIETHSNIVVNQTFAPADFVTVTGRESRCQCLFRHEPDMVF